MAIHSIRIATRNSPLALWQAEFIQTELQRHWPELHTQLISMTTSGDRFLKDNLQTLGGKGLFVKELEEALLENRADIAVHSMKDVPHLFPATLGLPIICKRANPFDAFVSPHFKQLKHLPEGATVGTSSLRRTAQLRTYRPDLNILPLRGNVGTRLARLDQGDYDALILATAGLQRLNLHHRINEILDDEWMLPACGQGALGIECRLDDLKTIELIKPLHHEQDALCVKVERKVNAALGGNCHTPIAIFCNLTPEHTLTLRAQITSIDGSETISDMQTGPQASATLLATRCADNLLKRGASRLLTS